MINLMPPAVKKEMHAARSNTLLLRYVILLICAFGFLLGALGITYYTLTQAATQADTTKQKNEQKASGYTEAQATARQLEANLTSAKALFTEEVRFSLVITRLSSLLPEGAAIDSFQLNNESFLQPIALTVRIRDRSAAESLQRSFASSPYITNVSLGNISTDQSVSAYPYTVELQFTFDRSIGQ